MKLINLIWRVIMHTISHVIHAFDSRLVTGWFIPLREVIQLGWVGAATEHLLMKRMACWELKVPESRATKKAGHAELCGRKTVVWRPEGTPLRVWQKTRLCLFAFFIERLCYCWDLLGTCSGSKKLTEEAHRCSNMLTCSGECRQDQLSASRMDPETVLKWMEGAVSSSSNKLYNRSCSSNKRYKRSSIVLWCCYWSCNKCNLACRGGAS